MGFTMHKDLSNFYLFFMIPNIHQGKNTKKIKAHILKNVMPTLCVSKNYLG